MPFASNPTNNYISNIYFVEDKIIYVSFVLNKKIYFILILTRYIFFKI
jgi:hypothetical protein